MNPSTITVTDLKARLDANQQLTLIDVREPPEFAAMRVPKAQLFPLSSFSPEQVVDVLRDEGWQPSEPVYVLCQLGGRAMQACQLLQQAGDYLPVLVEGGTQAWAEAGYPLDAG